MSKGMRKKIAVLLAAVMASAGLSACGGNTGADGGQDAESKTETKTDEAKTDSEKEGSGEEITIRLLTRMSGADSGTRMRVQMTATALRTSSKQMLHPAMWRTLSSGPASVS